MTETRTPAAAGPDRFLLGIVAGAIVLIVVSLVIVIVGNRPVDQMPADPETPVGVVEAYIEALRVGNLDSARELLSESARAELSAQDYRERFGGYPPNSESERRVLIEPIEVGADQAQVRVTISTFSTGPEPFSANSYHRDVTVYLTREDGAWRITRPFEPYALLY